ncbi:MAG TPA: formate--tetrahydrofolate ligase, partial [Anaerolineales bacterium]|nr:formate--tetrahydrofolate ligase [Anaerolineales bacterium]
MAKNTKKSKKPSPAKKRATAAGSATKKRGQRGAASGAGRAPAFAPTRLRLRRPVPSDIEIAQEAKLKPILQVARELGIREDELELFGPFKAKVKLEILERLK